MTSAEKRTSALRLAAIATVAVFSAFGLAGCATKPSSTATAPAAPVEITINPATPAPAPVEITINPTQKPAPAIPENFIGMSFGMKAIQPDKDGVRFFNPANKQLITLFQNLGLTNLRLGGTTVESPPETPIPGPADIDDLFAFAKAAGIKKIIYSLRLLETDPALDYKNKNAQIAKYICDHYRDQLHSFSIGNEPDLQRVFKQDHTIRNWDTYLARWKLFANTLVSAIPDIPLSGPDVAGNEKWIVNFAAEIKKSGHLAAVTLHKYVGEAGKDVKPADGIARILSRDWIQRNQNFHDKVAAPVKAMGLPFCFTEANDHYSGGATGSSETFAGALWALDFLHWWAAHGTQSIAFHNTQWKPNNIITLDKNKNLQPYPKAYGLRAFREGSRGAVETAKVSNPQKINLTTYAVRGATARYITIINKEYGPGAPAAEVTIIIPGSEKPAATLALITQTADPMAKTGITLGGDTIENNRPWNGAWTPLPLIQNPKSKIQNFQYTLTVPPTSAIVVRIPAP